MDKRLFFRGSYAPVIVQSIFERNLDVNAVIATFYSDIKYISQWHGLIADMPDMWHEWHGTGLGMYIKNSRTGKTDRAKTLLQNSAEAITPIGFAEFGKPYRRRYFDAIT